MHEVAAKVARAAQIASLQTVNINKISQNAYLALNLEPFHHMHQLISKSSFTFPLLDHISQLWRPRVIKDIEVLAKEE